MAGLKVTPEVLEKMRELRAGGESYRTIARRLHLNQDTVLRWLSPNFERYRNAYLARRNKRGVAHE